MKVLLNLVLVAMMGVSTQVMATPEEVVQRNDRVQITQSTQMKSAPQVKRVHRNDRVQLNKLVVTEINKFSERQDSIRKQRNDRVTLIAGLNS